MTEFADFPYEMVETDGESALAKWEELKKAGRGTPVVLGDELDNLLESFSPAERRQLDPIEEILAAAAAIRFPDDLLKLRRDEYAEAMAYVGNTTMTPADLGREEYDPPLGEWPATEARDGLGLSVAYDIRTGKPRSKVQIALIPTDDPTAIPAYLYYGNWNECPATAYHVAALRAWRDLYGAELIGLGADTLNLRVSRKPATREEALELARVQHAYCSDIIDQGVGSYRALAAVLMATDWWYFWWD
jgi:hypothetical protein